MMKNLKKIILLSVSHIFLCGLGFMAGIYTLPILTAPPAPSIVEIETLNAHSQYQAEFTTALQGSDILHWGAGQVTLSNTHITFAGELSPGPDFKLYLSPKFVETEVEFARIKSSMIAVGDVSTFKNFIVKSAEPINLEKYNTVIVWCESFGEFITAAKYR